MKKAIFLTSLLGVILLAGCGTKTPSVTVTPTTTGTVVKTYENSGFSVQYPATRTEQENVYGALVMFFSPQGSGDQLREIVGIVSEKLPSDMTVANYYTTIKTQILGLITGYQELSNEDITINGVAAKKIIYMGMQSNYELKWMQTFLIKNKVAYIISYTASAGTFDEFSKEATAIANSFTLK